MGGVSGSIPVPPMVEEITSLGDQAIFWDILTSRIWNIWPGIGGMGDGGGVCAVGLVVLRGLYFVLWLWVVCQYIKN